MEPFEWEEICMAIVRREAERLREYDRLYRDDLKRVAEINKANLNEEWV